jgi:integrase
VSGELVLVPITIKTAKNIVTGYFRAMIVQAMARHRVPNPDPFPGELLWPKPKNAELLVDQEPDPFEAWERDKILDWYLRNDRFWYPFVYFQFWTGCRPSETSALREANVDLERGTVRINKSRDEGEESLPKTRASRRTIALYPNVVEVLRTVRPKPLHSTPESYFFTVPDGRPIFTRDWPRDFGFYDVLTRLKIRQRKFYCTRHTSISWQLTTGANPWGVAKYHGTSMAMIDAH